MTEPRKRARWAYWLRPGPFVPWRICAFLVSCPMIRGALVGASRSHRWNEVAIAEGEDRVPQGQVRGFCAALGGGILSKKSM